MEAKGYAAYSSEGQFSDLTFERREARPQDVVIEIEYCGICHSDIHTMKGEFGPQSYPLIPGHEIVGKVKAVGQEITNFKIGDLVGVGCLIDSCRKCNACSKGLEQYCENGWTATYGGKDKIGGTKYSYTFGGYSNLITVDQRFILRIPKNLNPAAAAPLLCAGITTYSPLKKWKIGPGKKVGVIGLGGLGHMGVKIAHAMGANVVMITTSDKKVKDAQKLGANEVLISKDEKVMADMVCSFDFLLNTIPTEHNIDPYLQLLKTDATMVIVGAGAIKGIRGSTLIFKRRTVSGSLIGGLPETQEMLDFCGKHNITCDIEMISIKDVELAYERTMKGDVKYRFVIDMTSLKS